MRTARAAHYRATALRATARLLGTLDRDDLSPSAGSFDREQWAWKFRDFPLAMLQIGVLPMVELLTGEWPGNPFYRSERLTEWIQAALWNSLRRQHPNGAFDSVGPYTQDHGTTLAAVNYIARAVTRLGDGSLPADLTAAARDGVRRACVFAGSTSEGYAFISNHHALFALAWLRASELLGDSSLRTRADETVAAILEHQSPEGWYEEYGGADPGYETLGIAYLAEFLDKEPGGPLRESLRRSVQFLSHAVHPDGSVGGVYGSRFTSLWYPSGFEQLGADDPVADRLASFVAARLHEGQVVTPDTVDANNLPLIIWSYLRAAEHCEHRPAATGDALALPCEGLQGVQVFPDSGLIVAGTRRYYGVFHGHRGGVGVVYSRDTRRLTYQDAGYVVRAKGGTWTSALPPGGQAKLDQETTGCRLESSFGQALKVSLTPLSFVILRLLNLTVFRSPWLARLATRAIVGRLITGRRAAPLRLWRHLRFEPDRIAIDDSIRMDRPAPVERLVRARAFQPTHMGSASYYSARELEGPPLFEDAQATETLSARGEVTLSFEIVFEGEARVVPGPSRKARPEASRPRQG